MESLGIDIKLLIAQIINFGLFYFIFQRYISKPFSSFFNMEVEKEKEKEKVLQKLKMQEEEMLQKEKLLRQKIKNEEDQVIRSAKNEGEKVKTGILASAKKEADEMIARGKRQIAEERKKMEDQLNKQALDIAMTTVESGLAQFLDEKAQKSVNESILKNFKSK